jgi:hypothetical protein
MPVLVDDAAYDLARFEEVLPATVTITRTSEQDFKSRQLIVWVDAVRVATLLWGDSITCELQPGRLDMGLHLGRPTPTQRCLYDLSKPQELHNLLNRRPE